MTTFIVDSVPIDVTSYQLDSDGEIAEWSISIGGVKLPDSCDFLSHYTIADLEKQIKKHDAEEAEMLASDAAANVCLDRMVA